MKIIFDFTRKFFSRLIILALIALILIAFEAYKENQADIDKRIAKIDKKINLLKISNEKISQKIRNLEIKKNTTLKAVNNKTQEINQIAKELKQNKEKNFGHKLGPVKYSKKLFRLSQLQLKRLPLWIQYTGKMFEIVEATKEMAINNTKIATLEYQQTVIKQSNIIDYIILHNITLLKTHHLIILASIFYSLFFGRVTLKAINYYIFAPLARISSPILINDVDNMTESSIRYGTPQKEIVLPIKNNESLVVKPGWYTLSTAGLTRTRFFWKRSKPFSCYAMGLINMTEFRNNNSALREIKIASEINPNHAVIPVHLQDHPGYIVRHNHVVAISGDTLKLEKKWQFWDWRSWLYGNIRYVYFTGTGSIYVHGHGAVSTNDAIANSHIKEWHIIGMDTATPFKMTRADTFINYWLNKKPLYDIHFPKQGRFLQQQSLGIKDEKIFRSLLEDIMVAIGKVLGF